MQQYRPFRWQVCCHQAGSNEQLRDFKQIALKFTPLPNYFAFFENSAEEFQLAAAGVQIWSHANGFSFTLFAATAVTYAWSSTVETST
jgi:hypothetical protein